MLEETKDIDDVWVDEILHVLDLFTNLLYLFFSHLVSDYDLLQSNLLLGRDMLC